MSLHVFLSVSGSLNLPLPPVLPFCLLRCLYLPLTSTPHKAVTILKENPFLFTQIITLLLLVIELGCLVNGIVLEYNTLLNGAGWIMNSQG